MPSLNWFLLLVMVGVGEVPPADDGRHTASSAAAEPTILASLTYRESGFGCGTLDSLTILADGTIRSELTSDPERCHLRRPLPKPPAQRKLTSRELAQLIAAFEDKAYLFAQIVRDPPTLDHFSLVSISYARASSGTKPLKYEVGSFDPRARTIRDLESRIHEILGTQDWMR